MNATIPLDEAGMEAPPSPPPLSSEPDGNPATHAVPAPASTEVNAAKSQDLLQAALDDDNLEEFMKLDGDIDLNQTLLLCAQKGSIRIAKHLLGCGLDPEWADANEWTALHHAAHLGDSDMVQALLELQSPHARTSMWHTPLHLAVRAGNTSTMRLLLDVTSRDSVMIDKHGQTLLHLAIESDHKEYIQLLEDWFPSIAWSASRSDKPTSPNSAIVVDMTAAIDLRYGRVIDIRYGRVEDYLYCPLDVDIPARTSRGLDLRWIHLTEYNEQSAQVLLARFLTEERGWTANKALAKAKEYEEYISLPHASVFDEGVLHVEMPVIGLQREVDSDQEWDYAQRRPFTPDHLKPAHILKNNPQPPSQFGKMFNRSTTRSTLHYHRFESDTGSRWGSDERQIIHRRTKKRDSRASMIMVDMFKMVSFPCGLVITAMPAYHVEKGLRQSGLYQAEKHRDDTLGFILKSLSLLGTHFDMKELERLAATGSNTAYPSTAASFSMLLLSKLWWTPILLTITTDSHERNILQCFRDSLEGVRHAEKLLSLDAKLALAEAAAHQHGANSVWSDSADRLFNVITEMALLDEIESLRIDISAITAIMNQQSLVYKDLGEAGLPLREHIIEDIQWHIAAFISIKDDAQSFKLPVEHLVSQKQRLAPMIEARMAREQATTSARQGQMILVLTIVTIIFLPLTFIASFFTMPLASLPRVDDNIELSPRYVLQYVLGAGAAIAIPLVIFAIYFPEVVDAWFRAVPSLKNGLPTSWLSNRLGRRGKSKADEDLEAQRGGKV